MNENIENETMQDPKFTVFLAAYREAAAFTDCGLDSECEGAEWSEELDETLAGHAKVFWEANRDTILSAYDQAEKPEPRCGWPAQAGHDFWLTRNGHGAGFWDGDWPDGLGKALTDLAHLEGSYSLYLGGDGLVYGCDG